MDVGVDLANNGVPVAQLDSASASGAEGYRFESCRGRFWNPAWRHEKQRSRLAPPPSVSPFGVVWVYFGSSCRAFAVASRAAFMSCSVTAK